MEMTQQDFEERAARVEAGEGDDEDQRLVKHYYREGYELGAEPSDGSWLLGDDRPSDYTKLTKRELVAELESRKDANGDPLVFDRQASNATMVEVLKANDQLRADQES